MKILKKNILLVSIVLGIISIILGIIWYENREQKPLKYSKTKEEYEEKLRTYKFKTKFYSANFLRNRLFLTNDKNNILIQFDRTFNLMGYIWLTDVVYAIGSNTSGLIFVNSDDLKIRLLIENTIVQELAREEFLWFNSYVDFSLMVQEFSKDEIAEEIKKEGIIMIEILPDIKNKTFQIKVYNPKEQITYWLSVAQMTSYFINIENMISRFARDLVVELIREKILTPTPFFPEEKSQEIEEKGTKTGYLDEFWKEEGIDPITLKKLPKK